MKRDKQSAYERLNQVHFILLRVALVESKIMRLKDEKKREIAKERMKREGEEKTSFDVTEDVLHTVS